MQKGEKWGAGRHYFLYLAFFDRSWPDF